MRMIASILIFIFCNTLYVVAQNDYIVKTSSPTNIFSGEEEQFIEKNFPLETLCRWTPGMKFMFAPSTQQQFLPILTSYDTERDADNSLLKHKILVFIGTEEKIRELSIGTNYSTRFIFECEGKKYYHEVKNMRLDDICQKNPRAAISGLIYLKDVDKAKELLLGQSVYIQAESARIDDANSYSGYKEVIIPKNMPATITAIGVGDQISPVKIVFEDEQGRSYYLEVAFSRTNSGMDVADYQADKKMKYFANAFSLNNKETSAIETAKKKYVNQLAYPKKTIEAQREISFENKQSTSRVLLMRYTPLYIRDIKAADSGSRVVLSLEDQNKIIYYAEVDLKYDVIIKNENYIEDLFALEDIRKKYPAITEARWKLISAGEVEAGMSTDECRLSLGAPVEVHHKKDNRFETWFYHGKTLEFESGTLQRFK